MFDCLSGKTEEIEFEQKDGLVTTEYTFEEKGSCVFFVRDDEFFKSKKTDKTSASSINELLKGEWEIKETDANVMAFDKCDVYFNMSTKFSNLPATKVKKWRLQWILM